MRNFNHIETIYEKTLVVSLKRRREHIADPEGTPPKAVSPNEVHEILKAIYSQLDDDQEHLVMLVLNVSNEVSGFKVIASGSQSEGAGDSKIIFRNALKRASGKNLTLLLRRPAGRERWDSPNTIVLC